MKWLQMGLVVVLAGCGTREPNVRTFRVEVPVLVPCKTQEIMVPVWATIGLKKTDSLEVKVRALLAERRQRIGYERELSVAVNACSRLHSSENRFDKIQISEKAGLQKINEHQLF